MSRPIGIAVLGAGIGKAHALAIAGLPDHYRLLYVCDLDRARAEEAVSAVPGCKAVTDMAEVLADPEVEIAAICLPPRLHHAVTLKVLAAGKHAICEKPLTGSLREADEIIAAAERSGRQVFPVFQYRYGAGYRGVHALKQAGLLGKAYTLSIETHWQRGAAYYAPAWRGTWAGEMGGVIVSHACHAHNLATFLMGDVQEVAAFLETRVNPIETEDCAAIILRLASGALATSSVTVGAAGNSSRFRACFEHVTATSGTHPYQIGAGPWTFEATDPARQAEIDAVVAAAAEPPLRYAGQLVDIHARLSGQPDLYLPNLAEARHSVELMTALYASARGEGLVRLPLSADHPLYGGWQP